MMTHKERNEVTVKAIVYARQHGKTTAEVAALYEAEVTRLLLTRKPVDEGRNEQ